MPRIDLPSGYTWLVRFRRQTQLDGKIWERGPFGCFSLRLPILGRTFRIERLLTRWL